MSFIYALSLLILCLVWLVLGLFGLPGNWLMVASGAAYVWLLGPESEFGMGWETVAILGALALAGELLEFLASAVGVKRQGGSKTGAAMAMVGSLVGAIVGIFIGIPIPVVGPIIGVLLFASAGALLGAMLGESWKGKGKKEAWKVGKAAFWGRLFGTLGKSALGGAIAAVIAWDLFLS